VKIGKCNYHICGKREKLFQCKYCNRSFCDEHLKPKPPGLPRFSSTKPADRIFMEEWHKPGGHPCVQYVKRWEAKTREKQENYYKALDKVIKSNTVTGARAGWNKKSTQNSVEERRRDEERQRKWKEEWEEERGKRAEERTERANEEEIVTETPTKRSDRKTSPDSTAILLILVIIGVTIFLLVPQSVIESFGNGIIDTISGNDGISYSPTNYARLASLDDITVKFPTLYHNPIMTMPVKYHVTNQLEGGTSSGQYIQNLSHLDPTNIVRNATLAGLKMWEKETGGLIRFEEVDSPEKASLIINFTASSSGTYDSWILGYGGVIEYTNFRGYSLITKSALHIWFPWDKQYSRITQTVEHEFGHAIGLDHDDSIKSIMMSLSQDWYYTEKRISQKLGEALQTLYNGTNSKPDLRFENVNVKRYGDNFTFEVSVANYGFATSKPVDISISDGVMINEIYTIPEVSPGYVISFSVTRFKLDRSLNGSVPLKLYIDLQNNQEEINKNDNVMVLTQSIYSFGGSGQQSPRSNLTPQITLPAYSNPTTGDSGPSNTNPANPSNTNPATNSVKPQIDIAELEQKVYVLTNLERTSRGLAPVSWNAKAAGVARSYSAYLTSRTEYTGMIYYLSKASHTADGRNPWDRLNAGGVPFAGTAENLVPVSIVSSWYDYSTPAGYRSSSELAENAVAAWMGSTEGHRENILNPLWQEVGIGVATDATGTNYIITQDFISVTNCPSSERLCGGKCWTSCPAGSRFICSSGSGVCQY